MTNPFAPQAQTPPAQFPNADPAYARYLESLANGGWRGAPSPGVATYDQFVQSGHIPQGAPQYPPPFVPPQAPPLAQGSLDDFYGQPSVGGGPGWKFGTIGESHTGIVSRAIVAGDVQQITNIQGVPQTFRDGRPKFQLLVPVIQPDGTEATWYVKGADRDELARAMAEAGAPAGPPEKGAAIAVTFVKEKANGPGMNPSKIKAVRYARPNGAPVVNPTVKEEALISEGAAPTHPVISAQPAPTSPAPAAVTLDADQQALLAQLTGG